MIRKISPPCFIFIFLLFQPCTSTSIITPDKPLRDSHVLVSAEENFALGFFSPNNSSRRYVGIWYNKVSVQTVVWVANRDNPITSTSGVMSLDKSGDLVLYDSQKPDVVVWSTTIVTNLSSVVRSNVTIRNYSAELLDTGNLVVHEDNRKRDFLWQSFDYPTDTAVSNMKFGVDRRSGLNRVLTSWKSPDNPGTGSYSLMINDNGSIAQLILYRNRDPLWRAGPWNGPGWTGVPEMAADSNFIASYVDNPEEVYIINHIPYASIISRDTINESTGKLQRLIWQQIDQKWLNIFSAPKDKCDFFSHCGAFGECNIYKAGEYECLCPPGFEPKSPHDWNLRDGSQGCVRKREGRVCGNGEGFIKLAKMKLPDTTKARLDKNLGIKACEDLCLKNCSCMGYSAADVRGGRSSGCITWYDKLVDLREYSSGAQDFYLRVDAAELADKKDLHKSKRFPGFLKILFILLLSAAVLVLLSLAYWLIMKKKIEEKKEVNELGTSSIDVEFYPLSTILVATENFSPAHKVGEGGFGAVYKGKLDNGQEIAVKRLSNTSGQGIEEFRNEVTLIARLQHRNLVRLFGCCVQKEEKMLVYEYLPNKGLDGFLFDDEKRYMLDWKRRFDITLGIARGMVYLHHDSRLKIIHRDLKASNVLLDDHLNPKISDFGMARIFGSDQNEDTTRRVVGTYGYMSPEYAMEGLFSIKSDVFSFGILLLEIIMGRKNSAYYTENSVNLIGHVWDLWGQSRVMELVDQSLGESHEYDPEIFRCIHIGLLCVQESAIARPSMSKVVFMLCNDTSLPPPGQAAFIFRTAGIGPTNTGSSGVGACSVNEVTISMVQGR